MTEYKTEYTEESCQGQVRWISRRQAAFDKLKRKAVRDAIKRGVMV